MESTVLNQDVSAISGNLACAVSLPVISSWSGKDGHGSVRSTASAKSNISLSAKNKSDENVLLIPHFKAFVGYLIARDVPEVQTVLMSEEKALRLLHVYILTSGYDFDANEKIYDQQERLMRLFTGVDFDFHITPKQRYSDPDLKAVFSR